MKKEEQLNRFVSAQQEDYAIALAEMKQGRKRSHWMWYIFPQIAGLGFSDTARYYGIKNLAEAVAYLDHPILGYRLKEIARVLHSLPTGNAEEVFGHPDNLKLRSSLTLFAMVEGSDPVFQQLLDQFFGGIKDQRTVDILQK